MMANNTAPVQLRSHLFIFFFLVLASATYAQKNAVRFDHVEPAFWWTGMKNNTVQILFHNKSADLTSYQVSINHKGVVLKDLKKVENPHY